jgi:hypothetical protein
MILDQSEAEGQTQSWDNADSADPGRDALLRVRERIRDIQTRYQWRLPDRQEPVPTAVRLTASLPPTSAWSVFDHPGADSPHRAHQQWRSLRPVFLRRSLENG